jgi:hypothetical protein
MIFSFDESKLPPNTPMQKAVIERQVSYFADDQGMTALTEHLQQDDPWILVLRDIAWSFDENKKVEAFSTWKG